MTFAGIGLVILKHGGLWMKPPLKLSGCALRWRSMQMEIIGEWAGHLIRTVATSQAGLPAMFSKRNERPDMSDREINELSGLRGLFVGQLDQDEMRLFEKGVRAGIAFRSYEGVGAFLGLAKVGIR